MSKKTDAEVLSRVSRNVAHEADAGVLGRVAAQLLSDAHTDEKYHALQAIGKSAAESIRDMVAALECDYDRLEELNTDENNADINALRQTDEATELVKLREAAGDCESRDDAEQRIHEDPLSIQVRSDWYTPGEDKPTPGEYEILLSTGGPATRIIGDLDDDGTPTSARLQAQDWGTAWTEYNGCDEMPHSKVSEICLAYASCFMFGEG